MQYAMGMLVELKSLAMQFTDALGQPYDVLKGIELECLSGTATVLHGPSGSGKSTLLNLIAGLLTPTSGEVWIGKHCISQLAETKRDRFRADHIGYVFQTFNLLSPLSVLENLTVPAALTGRGTKDIEKRAAEILGELGLEAHHHKRPYELSVGQRQRVAVARAVLQRPQVLLADEPTANLDRNAAKVVIETMKQMLDGGTTVIIATHDSHVEEAFDATVLDVCSGVRS